MKKTLKRVFAVVMAICIVMMYSVTAMAADNLPWHYHVLGDPEWKLVSETKATCTEEGKRVYECQTRAIRRDGEFLGLCREKAEITIPKLNHDYQNVTTPATCITDGKVESKCSKCGDIKSTTVISATGEHVYGEWEVTTPATCITAGEKERVCTADANCTEKETATVDPTGEHKYGEWEVITPATCITAGEKERTCTVDAICTAKETATVDPTGEHKYGEWEVTTKPTCVDAGEETRICEADNNCTAKETRTIDPTGKHTYNDEGVCTVCGKTIEDNNETVPDDENTPDDKIEVGHITGTHYKTIHMGKTLEITYTPVIQSNTTIVWKTNNDNVKITSEGNGKVCIVAGEKAGRTVIRPTYNGMDILTGTIIIVNVTDHKWDNGKTTEATCTSATKTTYTCTVDGCGKTKVETTGEALGHDMQTVEGSAKAATCKEAGKEADKKCSRCDYTETGKTIEKTNNHQWGDWVKVNAPSAGSTPYQMSATITTYEERTCSVCGAKEYKTNTETLTDPDTNGGGTGVPPADDNPSVDPEGSDNPVPTPPEEDEITGDAPGSDALGNGSDVIDSDAMGNPDAIDGDDADDVDAEAAGTKTGDSTDMIPWAVGFGAALVLLGGAVALRRREN